MAYFASMKRGLISLFLLFSALFPALGQSEETIRAALYLTGADTAEELDDRLLEELESFRSRPIELNRSSRARMLESGLLSPYQVASLEDYRSLSGDVLSFAELELVDGFGKEAVTVLRPFLSLSSSRRPGEAVKDTVRITHSAVLRPEPGAGAMELSMPFTVPVAARSFLATIIPGTGRGSPSGALSSFPG